MREDDNSIRFFLRSRLFLLRGFLGGGLFGRSALGFCYKGLDFRSSHQFAPRHFNALESAFLHKLPYPLLRYSPDARCFRLGDPVLEILSGIDIYS